MAVRTGYKKSEIRGLACRISDRSNALVAALPEDPLRELHLVCCCDRCIDPEALQRIRKTPPTRLTDDLINQYFGGAAAVEAATDEQARLEAYIILTHVIAHLGHMTTLPDAEARDYSRQHHYLPADYLIPYLFATGFAPRLGPQKQAEINDYLLDLARYAVAKRARSFDNVLCYLSLFGNRLPDLFEEFRQARPLRQLRLWTTLARGHVTSHPDGRASPKDLHLWFSGMPLADRQHLLAALEAPQTAMLIERFAFAARDRDWLTYLSRLLEWREMSILATRYSEYKDGRH
ncbi:hypothetical protein V8J82_20450 [Gymnodinialimonas sp. 2305UL16-5]|uniref:hypothetical protein n=1 Tax=Gymnodinialimonas mytili TaxID=3126503 RepID=UPI003096CC95